MGWNNYNKGGQQAPSDQIDNMVVQSSVAFQLGAIMKEIQEIGSGKEGREKAHMTSARLLIISLIYYCGKQVNGKSFSKEENEKLNSMEIPDLMAELSFWQGESGMMLSREAPKSNFFSKMLKYWEVVKANKDIYVKQDAELRKSYKVIIIPADKATKEDIDDADEIIEEEAHDILKLKKQPSKIAHPAQDKPETKEVPVESPETAPEAEIPQEKVV